MKSVVRRFGIAIACALTLGACNMLDGMMGEVDYGKGSELGYLSFSNFEATIMVETENENDPAGTRAAGVDINDFDVVVTNAEGKSVASFKYGERPTTPLELKGGIYTVRMSSGQMAGAAWEAPQYAAEREVVVVRQQTTTVDNFVCRLANIKVTVGYAADLLEQLNPDYTKLTVALEDSSLDYLHGEERAGYFAPVAKENTLKVSFQCRYVDGQNDIVMTNEIKGVKAAQWRKINVVIQHASDGTANLGIVCESWTYDEEVTFDTSVFMFEELIPDDTDAPQITLDGHDLTKPFVLNDTMFDADGNITANLRLSIEAKNPIKSLTVKASSDSAAFTDGYALMMPLEEDLCAPTTAAATLEAMGYPADAKGATAVVLDFAAQAALLSTEGVHSYEISVVDTLGAQSSAVLSISYGKATGPAIEWISDEYMLDTRYTIVDGMTCDISVTSATGITEFFVDISSEALEELLTGAGIPTRFSLVNDKDIFTTLNGLGFPTGEDVEGATSMELSITTFLGVLMGVPGNHDFTMEVTDASGTTIKTIMLAAAGA